MEGKELKAFLQAEESFFRLASDKHHDPLPESFAWPAWQIVF